MAWTLPDFILFFCQVTMLFAMYPMLTHRARWPNEATCLLTATALSVSALTFLYLGLYITFAMTAAIAACWWVMCVRREDDETWRKPSLHWDTVHLLKGYESWEAHLILENSWSGRGGLPTLTQEDYDWMMSLQTRRNDVLKRLEEKQNEV